MKKHFWKYIAKSIKHDLSRIITITSIVGLGVGFLVGLLSTTPDLFKTMDKYYDDARFADITIRSTVGFDSETPKLLKEKVDGIEDVVLTYEEENYIDFEINRVLSRISYRPMGDEQIMDLLTLEEGRWPETSDECVVLKSNQTTINIEEGDRIRYTNYAGDTLYGNVVGVVRDPNYVTYQAEQSFMTGGTIKSYIYFDINTFSNNFIYTNAYVRFSDTKAMDSFSSQYDDYVRNKQTEIAGLEDEFTAVQKEKLAEQLKDQMRPAAIEQAKQELKTMLEGLGLSGKALEDAINLAVSQDLFKQQVEAKLEEAIQEQIKNMDATWYVLNRDAVKSAYVFKSDALKVQTIAMIFPPFFFLIALLVCLSSISRIITKDRQIIGTFKALGFTKGRIALKYLLYGLISSFIGCFIGVAIGLFAIPAALMYVYSTIYYFQSMQFVFTAGVVFGCTLLMMGMITAVVLGVVYINLREPAASLMMGTKAPKPGKKIILERIPFIWNRLKFKYKSTFRNIFRFKKNLLMMIIGVGGCTGLLLTGFGIKDSFSVISNDQYKDIVKYDAVITTNELGVDPKLIFDDETIAEEHYSVTYTHGTIYGKDSVNVEIFGADKGIENYVGLTNLDGEKINFHSRSIIITEQIAEIFNRNVNDVINVVTDYGDANLIITDICANYVSNYIYFGSAAFKSAFGVDISQETNNAFLLRLPQMNTQEKQDHLDTYASNEKVKAVISTTETRQTYDAIVGNLGMIVGLITILSGCLAAIVIYNLTDININERIREIATLRVCGYSRREVLMYILREILVMSLIGIGVGLGIGVFLHWFIIVNISSVGIFFLRSIHWSSYLITVAISTVFVVGVSFCFYPKIKKVSMTESLKSVD